MPKIEKGNAKISSNGNQKNNKLLIEYARSKTEPILKEFDTPIKGISDAEANRRLEKYGHNELAKKKGISVINMIFSKFCNPLVVLLIVIVIFSVYFGEDISALFVFIMILISVFLAFFQEYKSEKAVEKLNELVRTKVEVHRDGMEKEIDIRKIVPGDIVDLFAGDMIPADLRIISCKDLFINQASLTGESFPVEKIADTIDPKSTSLTELNNIAFMGSSVVSGTGLGLVLKTGINTQFGEISKKIATTGIETSFEKGIKQFVMLMIRFMLILVIFIFFVILFLKHGSFKDALLFSLAVTVGLTPEMLPMLVTINLSKGATQMAKKKVIVKRLNSIQNFGAMDVLCTDKTGTLTLNKIILEVHCDVTGRGNEDVLKYAYINSSYQTGLKNLLDRAILNHEKLVVKNFKKIDEIPFDFSRKIMSVVVRMNHKHVIISKGAPEEIFERCTHYELDDKIHAMHRDILSNLKKEYDNLSGKGFRVLAVAYREIEKEKDVYSKDDEKDLVLKGYVAFLDPAKPTAKETLTLLKKLNIEVKVLTGDNEFVTKKICDDVGLETKGIVTGNHLDNLSDKELGELVEKTNIFALLTPIQKERIIKSLHNNKHIVGYLGDGINDAPSLKTSDIGITVNNAVDIAKESADIILLEKSLRVLEDGVLEGRKVFGNIIKYVKMGASSNFGNMLSMTGATLIIPFLPMLPIQILLNNLLYDFSQVSLPTDDVDKEYLEKPRPWDISFIKKFIISIGPLSSIFDFLTFGVMWFIFLASNLTPYTQSLFHTGWFLESLCTQTLVVYIIRTNKIPFIQSRPSKYLIATTLLILFGALIILFSPLAHAFGFVGLPILYFVILFGMIVAYLVLVQFVKTWVVKRYGYQ